MKSKTTSGNTQSLWFDTFIPTHFPALEENITTDICIIGAGIAGLSIAYRLIMAGLKVVVVEDGRIGSGETGRTTAHLSNALDDRYANIIKVHGKKIATLAARSHTLAIDLIADIIKNENIDCDFSRVKGYLFADKENDISILENEFVAAKKCGVEVKLIDQKYVSSPVKNILEFKNQAQFHPLKYLQGLANAIILRGGSIYENTHVDKIVEINDKIILTTNHNHKITAEKIVQATNIPIDSNLSLHFKQEAYRTYVIAAEIPEHAYQPALFWDTKDPYHYVRFYRDESAVKRPAVHYIIVGGEDHRTGHEPKKEPFALLETWAKKYFPEMGEVKYKWSGQVVEPIDYLAFIGKNPNNKKNNYIVTSDSGNGMTHGTLSAILLAELILNDQAKWQSVYQPKRIVYRPFNDLVTHCIATFGAYLKYLQSSDIKNKKNLLPNQGAVVNEGLHKVAIFRDENGKFHRFSAVCPHLKAILQWNAIESTWDCPAHGSRFSALGEVINSPANCDLKCIRK